MWTPETNDPSILKYVYDFTGNYLKDEAEKSIKHCADAIAKNEARLKEIPEENKRLAESIQRLNGYLAKLEARKAEAKLAETDVERYALVVKGDFGGVEYRFEPWVVVKASVPGTVIKQKYRSDIITGPRKLPENALEVYNLRWSSGYGSFVDREFMDGKYGFKTYKWADHRNAKTLAMQDAIKYVKGDKARVFYIENR